MPLLLNRAPTASSLLASKAASSRARILKLWRRALTAARDEILATEVEAAARAGDRGRLRAALLPAVDRLRAVLEADLPALLLLAVDDGAAIAARFLPPQAPSARAAAEWDESLHPRDERGQFGSGGGASASHVLSQPGVIMGLGRLPPEGVRTYLAAHGQEWTAAPLPAGIPAGTPQQCYANATRLIIARDTLRYAEGIAYADSVELPSGEAPAVMGFLHAWAVTPDGTVIDPTWTHPERNRYFGVAYDSGPYLAHVMRTETYGVLGGETAAAQAALAAGGLTGRKAAARTAEWDESLHPRDDQGQFSSGGGGGDTYPPARDDETLLTRSVGGIDSLTQFTRPDGTLTPERQALHNAIIAEVLGQHAVQAAPIAFMKGGGPAAGKTAMDQQLSLPPDHVKVDVDAVRALLPEYQAELDDAQNTGRHANAQLAMYTHEEASLLSKQIVAEAIAQKNHVLIDGTGDSGIEGLTAKVAGYRAGGHQVVGNYVTCDTATALARAKERGDRTGRYVAPFITTWTHRDVSQVVPQAIAAGLFDQFALWDTNDSVLLKDGTFSPPLKVASAVGTTLTVHDPAAWGRFLAKGQP